MPTIDEQIEELNKQGAELDKTYRQLREKHTWIGQRRSDPEKAIRAVVTLVQEAFFEKTPKSVAAAREAISVVRDVYSQFNDGEYGQPLAQTKQFVEDYIIKHPDSRLAIEAREENRPSE